MAQKQESGCLPCTNCFVTVPQDKYYAVENFGKYSHMLKPGLSFAGFDCCGCCIQYRSITSRVDQLMVQVHTKTKDNVFVTAKVAVQQSVMPENTVEAIYKLSDVHAQIDSYVSDVVRSAVPHMSLDETFEKKDDISIQVQQKLTVEMSNYGFQIHKALVTEMVPNHEVVASMNEINKQKRLRDAAIMAAEGEADNTVDAIYKLSDVHAQIDSYVSDVVRSCVPHLTLDESFEKKDDISNSVQQRLTVEMGHYGFQIHKALVTELVPNAEVVQSMNEINKQKRLRDAAIMAAEGEKIRVVKAAEAAADAAQLQGEGIARQRRAIIDGLVTPSMNEINKQKRLRDAAIMAAEGEKIRVVKAAEAVADAAQLQGEGIARQRRAIIDGLRDSITHGTQEALSTEKISELLLITQYFETLRDIAANSKASVVFLPHSAGAVSDVASQIRNGIMQAGAGAPGQQRM
eukprot:CAMPEP_0204092082 /NCGR_PEP_ID=MMETSP0360-20130528/189728_1 /ASSEMBLY_ACC=CAM_ASM_000342 /TAXON_ID=268821 /ORGANISM="Scrippsiella Hangoei, Strain SHTV-5" /LENGTH=460 /DNA_ID=CAMNT_0051041351 /DNA_START=104 /DNA_END=1488 /DNA_ORIENTATION=+